MKQLLYSILFLLLLAQVAFSQLSDPTKGNGSTNLQIRDNSPKIDYTHQIMPDGFYENSSHQMKPNTVIDNKGTEFWLCMERNIDDGL